MEIYDLFGGEIGEKVTIFLAFGILFLPIIAVLLIFLPSSKKIFAETDKIGERIKILIDEIKLTAEEIDPNTKNEKPKKRLKTTFIIWLVNFAFCFSVFIFLAVPVLAITTIILIIHIIIYYFRYQKLSNNE